MNPFALVKCHNTDADEAHSIMMPRWRLWWCQWFGNEYAKCWVEI